MAESKTRLLAAGFSELKMSESWRVQPSGKVTLCVCVCVCGGGGGGGGGRFLSPHLLCNGTSCCFVDGHFEVLRSDHTDPAGDVFV